MTTLFRSEDLLNFYKNKTIQRPNFFYVYINDDSYEKVIKPLGDVPPLPKVEHYLVKNVNVPNYNFKKEVVPHGPLIKSFPVMDNKEGFNIKITVEEDAYGTIARLVYCLQRRIINPEGLYYNPDLVKIASIWVQVSDEADEQIVGYRFMNCYFLNAQEVTYDYGAEGAVQVELTFNADWVDRDFTYELLDDSKHASQIDYTQYSMTPVVSDTTPPAPASKPSTQASKPSTQASKPAKATAPIVNTSKGSKTVTQVTKKSSVGMSQTSRMVIKK